MKVLNIVLPALFVCSLVHADVTKLSLKSQQAANVLTEIVAIPDKSIPLSLIERSSCIAVVPNVIRAGFIFGARYGKGLVSCRVANGWSSPLFIDVTGGSWGLQFGIQSIDLVLVFTRPNAAQKFSQPNFTIGADATVAAGPLGRDAQAGTDYKLNSEIYSYSRARGLFAGLTFEGSVISADKDDNTEIYGSSVSFNSLLLNDRTISPLVMMPYLTALKMYAH